MCAVFLRIIILRCIALLYVMHFWPSQADAQQFIIIHIINHLYVHMQYFWASNVHLHNSWAVLGIIVLCCIS